MVTNFTYRPSLVKIDAHNFELLPTRIVRRDSLKSRVGNGKLRSSEIVVTDPQKPTNKQTHKDIDN